MDSPALDQTDRLFFERSYLGKDKNGQKRSAADITHSLKRLTEFLRKDSGKRTVVLLDEYDVPLENACTNGYGRKMGNVIGPLLQNVLKTNSENLQFAVVTGCLRPAKEEIWSGLNHPEVNTVLSIREGDAIGFTEEETRKLLQDSGVGEHCQQVREWYEGYRFGNTVIYNPWSVIKFIEDKKVSPDAPPLTYWGSTGSNVIIQELAEKADQDTKELIDRAMQGEEISFPVQESIAYDKLFEKPENVLNVLLTAGYLTAVHFDGTAVRVRIPNKEVHEIFRNQIRDWFAQAVKTFDVHSLYAAMEQWDTAQMEVILTEEFLSVMNYHDSAEAFYHGVLLTLMQLNQEYLCVSNRESGTGRFDIMAKQRSRWNLGFVLEVKISGMPGELLSDAREGAKQITEKEYVKELLREGYRTVKTYSLAFCEKRCRVIQGGNHPGKCQANDVLIAVNRQSRTSCRLRGISFADGCVSGTKRSGTVPDME